MITTLKFIALIQFILLSIYCCSHLEYLIVLLVVCVFPTLLMILTETIKETKETK
jgi:hypothetical protein